MTMRTARKINHNLAYRQFWPGPYYYPAQIYRAHVLCLRYLSRKPS